MKGNKMSYLVNYLCWAVIFLFSQTALASTAVFEISKGEQKLFIAGTVHILPSSEFPLPEAFDLAYQQSSIMVFEADIRQLETAAGMQLLMQHARYQDGNRLKQVLNTANYQALDKQAAALGLNIQALDSFKPDFVIINLMQLALNKAGLAGEGVDKFYLNKAIADNRELAFLETIEQQLGLLFNASTGNEDWFVQFSLAQLQDIETQLKQIIGAWRKGNLTVLAELAMEGADTAAGQQFYQRMLVQRNQAWISQLEAMLKTKEVEMVLVGALHLAGDANVLDLLREKGYQVKQL
ncbi:TraB/GumN family protein [Rheinheimera sp. WS51]|uniref:TraB/GumN family protein n=1 Tax=Rheinheimera sp. WS51 TaxID=3425886 RepID=UPI003D8F31E8